MIDQTIDKRQEVIHTALFTMMGDFIHQSKSSFINIVAKTSLGL